MTEWFYNDCGLFAIVFATSLCSDKQPESYFYDQQKMSSRSHFLRCFERGILEEFSVVKKRKIRKIVKTQIIGIHCICRMPEISGAPMI